MKPGAWNAVSNSRARTAKPAALMAPAMNSVMGTGAPSYTSGVHMWKGTAETLNPRATIHSSMPTCAISGADTTSCSSQYRPISATSSDPVAPYKNAVPSSKNAPATPPVTKYFKPASTDIGERTREAARTYTARLITSSPRNSVIKSDAATNTNAPVTANKMSAW